MFPKERSSGGNREVDQEAYLDIGNLPYLAELQKPAVVAFQHGDGLLVHDDFMSYMEARGNREDKGKGFKEAFEMYEMNGTDCTVPGSFRGKYNFVDPKVFVPPSDENLETKAKKHEIGICSMLAGMFTLLFYANGETDDVLPVSSNNLPDASLEQKAFTLKNFLRSVLAISPREHGFLLTLFGYFLSYFTKNSTTPFDQSQSEITTNSIPQSLVNFREAIFGYSPEIAHITAFMICYLINWILVVPLALRLRLFLIPLLFYVPFLYFPDLLRKASALRVHVACGGSFNQLPLIAFVTSVAFGITLVFVLVTLLVLYVRLFHGKTPTSTQDEVILDEDDLNADVFV